MLDKMPPINHQKLHHLCLQCTATSAVLHADDAPAYTIVQVSNPPATACCACGAENENGIVVQFKEPLDLIACEASMRFDAAKPEPAPDDETEEAEGPRWWKQAHPCCKPCLERVYGLDPKEVTRPPAPWDMETCCFCDEGTQFGIYVGPHPGMQHCPGEHSDTEYTPATPTFVEALDKAFERLGATIESAALAPQEVVEAS